MGLCGEGNDDAKRQCLVDKADVKRQCLDVKSPSETRYGSRATMIERMINTKRIYEKLMLDQEYISWLDRQAAKTKEKVRLCICNVISVRNSNMDIYVYIVHV